MAGLQTRFILSRDGKGLRTAVWDTAGATRGVCVLLDGQTEFLEKYDEVAGELNARGFRVAALDWRGQGGSARALANGLKAHVSDFTEYDADLSAFLEQVVKPISDNKMPIALAHSMGGQILMRALHEKPDLFQAAVVSAPMMRPLTRGYPPTLARVVCMAENFAGQQDSWVWGMDKRDPLVMSFEDNLVTSDRARFARNQAILVAQKDIRLAGPTWGWLEAAYRSMDRSMADGFAQSITTPLLIIGAGRDKIVDTRASRQFASRLPNGSYLEFAEAEHEIMMENDSIRDWFWKAFDAFVGRFV